MYALLRLIQKLIATLNSDGTPGQVAAGIAVGTVFGLTPLISLHNLLILGIVILVRVTLPAVMLGWMVAIPLGFAFDPLFHSFGQTMLRDLQLRVVWVEMTNTPVLALFRLNNSVVLGSLVNWMIAALPIYFVARWLVGKYRVTIYARLRKSKLFKWLRATRVYNFYRWFVPE